MYRLTHHSRNFTLYRFTLFPFFSCLSFDVSNDDHSVLDIGILNMIQVSRPECFFCPNPTYGVLRYFILGDLVGVALYRTWQSCQVIVQLLKFR